MVLFLFYVFLSVRGGRGIILRLGSSKAGWTISKVEVVGEQRSAAAEREIVRDTGDIANQESGECATIEVEKRRRANFKNIRFALHWREINSQGFVQIQRRCKAFFEK